MGKRFGFGKLMRALRASHERNKVTRKNHAIGRRPVQFEPLEPRLLLSADISGSIGLNVLPDMVLPEDTASAVVTVKNAGTTAISQAVRVNVYASLNGAFDASDILLGSADTNSTKLNSGQSKSVSVALTLPNTIGSGAYQLLAVLDANNKLAESNEANNVIAGEGFNVAWKFGDIPGRSSDVTLRLRDADGTLVTFNLDGIGTGEVVRDGADWDVKVTGTNASSVLRVATDAGGNDRVKIDDIHVFGALGAVAAPTLDLTGTLAVDGALTAGLLLGSATNALIAAPTITGASFLCLTVRGIAILGDMKGSEIRIGDSLGADGQPGGTGVNADVYGAGRLGDLLIGGTVTSSFVRVGQDPIDGVFDNGDDAFRGGSASAIDSVTIGGGLSSDSRVIAASLPAKAWVQGKQIPTANDARFKSDVHGPDIMLALQNDTGASASDRLTYDATVFGRVSDPSGLSALKAGFGANPSFSILTDLRGDGTFTLTRARLEQIKGSPLADGVQSLTVLATDRQGNALRGTLTFTLDTGAPTVTINQSATQADPTNIAPVGFTVRFSEAVTGFTASDIALSGTVGGILQSIVTGSGADYGVAVTGMQGTGTVVASIAAGVAFDLAGNGSRASTSLDNTVAFDNKAPTVTINQATGQIDPANLGPVLFSVDFSEAVSGFAANDISLASSTVGGTLAAIVSGSGVHYTVSVTGMQGEGVVIATVNAGAANDLAGNLSLASTSTDNTVAFDDNDVPIANSDSYSTDEDTPLVVASGLGVLANDTDGDGDSLTAILVSGPTADTGTLALNADGSFTFAPAANFNGPVAFTYKVNDGAVDSGVATVTIDVRPVNDAPELILPVSIGGPISAEQIVNTTTLGAQSDPDIAILADGSYVITWTSAGQDGSGLGIFAQRFDESGLKLGGEFAVNTSTDSDQQNASVIALANGGFAVTWETHAATGDRLGIQCYDAAGARLGSEIQVDSFVSAAGPNSSVTALADGGFIVVWGGSESGPSSIFGQRYNAQGVQQSDAFVVDSAATGIRMNPMVASLGDGGYVVVWARNGNYFLRCYDAGGSSTAFGSVASGPVLSVTGLAGGGFVLISQHSDGDGSGIFGQRYGQAGALIGGEFQVNTTSAGNQQHPTAVALTGGGFVVAWESQQGGSGLDILGQRYNALGLAIGSEFQLNTTMAGSQTSVALAVTQDGHLAAVWDSTLQDGSSSGIIANLGAGGATTVNEHETLAFTVSATDVDTPLADLRFSLENAPEGATIDPVTGLFAWTPTEAQGSQTYSMTISVSDNGTPELRDSETIMLMVDEVNESPIVSDDHYTIDEDTQLETNVGLGVLANDTDGDGDILTAILVSGPTADAGTLALNADGSFTFAPAANFNGPVAFTYKVNDGAVDSGVATVTIDVRPVNDAPELILPVSIGGPISAEQIVNTTTLGAQSDPDIAILADGSYVITWTSAGQDGSGLGIFAQRFDESGLKLGGEFAVNTSTDSDQQNASVIALANGGFAVTWETHAATGDRLGIQCYDAAGARLGSEIQVDSFVSAAGPNSSVTALADGGFIVVWGGSESGPSSIFGQRYNAQGVQQSDAFVVDSAATGIRMNPMVASLGDGGYVVVWARNGNYFLRCYDAGGSSTAFGSVASGPVLSVTGLAGGGFVLISQHSDGDGSGIFGQRYGQAGALIGGEFQVNTTSAGNQQHPTAVALTGGGFVVAWESQQGGSGLDILGQRYNALGLAIGSEFQLNTTMAGSQTSVALAVTQDGHLAAVWDSTLQDGSSSGIIANLGAGGATTVNEHETLAFTVSATDVDTPLADLRFSLENAPEGATIDPVTGLFAWTSTHTGVYRFDVVVKDNGTPVLSDSEQITVNVLEAGSLVFEDLGNLPDGANSSQAFGISGDGSTVVGSVRGIDGFLQAFIWTAASGIVGLGGLELLPGENHSSEADAASADGSVVVGWSNTSLGREAFIWTAASGMVGLGDLPGGDSYSEATAVSADGSVVVGASDSALGREAFIWTAETGMVGLGDLPGRRFSSIATGVSADGTVVVGIADRPSDNFGIASAFRWTAETGMQRLLPPEQLAPLAISGDGTVVAGAGFNFQGVSGTQGFYWYEALPNMLGNIGDLGVGQITSAVRAVSYDGSVLVGYGTPDEDINHDGDIDTDDHEAVIYDLNGLKNLRETLITRYGLGEELEGWILSEATAISADGKTIAGWGESPDGHNKAWVVTLPDQSAPVLEPIDNQSSAVDETLNFVAKANDYDDPPDSLTFSLDGAVPQGATIDPATGVFTWTPAQTGMYRFDVVVTDDGTPALSDRQEIAITVLEAGSSNFHDLELPVGMNGSQALGISADGSTVVGSLQGGGTQAFIWTATSGIVELGVLEPLNPGEQFSSEADAVSANGSVVAGWSRSSLGRQAFIWTATTGMVGLGDLPGGDFYSEATAVSADGSVVVGVSESALGKEAFIWTAETGMVGLGDLPGGRFSSIATGISADGSVVIGIADRPSDISLAASAFRWTAETGMQRLGEFHYLLEPNAISGDSTVIVGRGINFQGFSGAQGFYWNEALPNMLGNIGDLGAGQITSSVRAVSYDGSVLAGYGTPDEDINHDGNIDTDDHEAVIYDLNGLQNLQEALIARFGLGQELEGWILSEATAISADGKTIAGWGESPDGHNKAWVVTLPDQSAPVLDPIGSKSVRQGDLLTFSASATDLDSSPSDLFFFIENAPDGALIDPVTGAFTWTPAETQGPGSYEIMFNVVDDSVPAQRDSETIRIEVQEATQTTSLDAINEKGIAAGSLLTLLQPHEPLPDETGGKMELVTVVVHEMGHLLGFDHDNADRYPVMRSELDPGVRYVLDGANQYAHASKHAGVGASEQATHDAMIDWHPHASLWAQLQLGLPSFGHRHSHVAEFAPWPGESSKS